MTEDMSNPDSIDLERDHQVKTDAEIAREALEILDADGWCKGALTMISTPWNPDWDYKAGSHCIGGAVNLAMWQQAGWHVAGDGFYARLANLIREQYPEYVSTHSLVLSFRDAPSLKDIAFIADWNNAPERTEADVRRILEKMAAGENTSS